MDTAWLKRALPRMTLSGMALLFGLGLAMGGFRLYQLTEHGQVTRGRLVSKDIRRESKGSGSSSSSSIRYLVFYVFTAPDGQEIHGSGSVAVENWQKLQPGDTLEVAYLPENPQVNSLGGQPGLLGGGVAILLMALGGSLVALGTERALRVARERWVELRLLREGVPAVGVIRRFDIHQSNLPWSRILYSYQDPGGRVLRGASLGFYRTEIANLCIGDAGTVRYNPQRPEQSLWVLGPAKARAAAGSATPPSPVLRAEAEATLKEIGARPTARISADLVGSVELALAVEKARKWRGLRTLAAGLALLGAGGGLFYYFFVRQWLAGGTVSAGDEVATTAGFAAVVLLLFGFFLTLIGVIIRLGPVLSIVTGALLLAVGIGTVVYYGSHVPKGVTIEGKEAIPAALGMLALVLGMLVLPISIVYAVIRGAASQVEEAIMDEARQKIAKL